MTGGHGSISATRLRNLRILDVLSLGADLPVAGRPQVRGQAGYVQRWGDLWFEEIRDTSSGGWRFEKSNKDHVNKLCQMLLKICRVREPSRAPLALSDSPLALEDNLLALQDSVVSS